MYRLLVLTGASGVGKSTMLFRLVGSGFCEIAPKYSERLRRKGKDDIIHVDNIYDAVHSCDIIYEMYNTRYGINSDEIRFKLESNNQVLIIGDIDSLVRLRSVFSRNMTAIYIFPSDNCLGNLIEASVYRGELTISSQEKRELMSIARKISELVRLRNLEEFRKYDEEFCAKMRTFYFDRPGFYTFMKRYESWYKAHDVFDKHAALFDFAFEAGIDSFPQLLALTRTFKNE